MKELTPRQEDIIGDLIYHKKRLKEEIGKNKKRYKVIPVDPERLDYILKKIGRRKL